MNNKLSIKSNFKIRNYFFDLYDARLFLFLFVSFHVTARSLLHLNTFIILGFYAITIMLTFFCKLKFKPNAQNISWMLLLCIVMIFNQDIRMGNPLLAFNFLYTGFIIFSFQNTSKWYQSARKLFTFFVAEHIGFGFLFLMFPSFYNSYILSHFSGVEKADIIKIGANRGVLMGLCNHYSTSGLYCGIGLIVAGCYFLANPKPTKKQLLFLLVTFAALVLTKKRGPLLFAVFAVLCIFISYRGISFKTVLKLSAVMIAGIIAIIISYHYSDAVKEAFSRFIISDNDSTDELTSGRLPLYQLAIRLFLEHPLLGVGWGGYKYEYTKYLGANFNSSYTTLNAHNVYLQALSEIGIIGTVLLLSILFSTLAMAVVCLNKSKKTLCPYEEKWMLMFSVGIQIFFLTTGITGNSLYYEQMLFPYALGCAITYYYYPKIIFNPLSGYKKKRQAPLIRIKI